MTSALRARASIANEVRRQRREIALRSPENFAAVYLKHHQKQPPSSMHTELFRLLNDAGTARGARIAVAAPRGHAKSTVVSLIYVLWAVMKGSEPFVVIVSATRDQAAQHLKNVRHELEGNPLLRQDFPDLLDPSKRPKPWRKTAIQLPSGALIKAAGAGEQIRGTRQFEHRPSLIICDDLEMPEHVESGDQRRKTEEWFGKALLKAGDGRTNVVFVGTVLHYDSLLAKYATGRPQPGWTGMKFKALVKPPNAASNWETWQNIYSGDAEWEDQTGTKAALAYYRAHEAEMLAGSEVLWPERESLYDLMELLVREGRSSFDSEKQNEPLDPDQCLFRPDRLSFWDDDYADALTLVRALGSKAHTVIAWDPALGTTPRKGDYPAIVVVTQDLSTKRCYVLAADIARPTPDEAMQTIVRLAQLFSPKKIAIESNGFQQTLEPQLAETLRKARLNVRPSGIKNSSNKRSRIALLQPDIEHGRLVFSRRHSVLLEQLRQFPLGAHDDGPDALEMAIRAIQKPRPKMILI